jgi:hypothetical protein
MRPGGVPGRREYAGLLFCLARIVRLERKQVQEVGHDV